MLLIAAILWGTTFVAQSEGMEYVGPLTYQATRSVLGGLFLIPIILFGDMMKKKKGTYIAPTKRIKRKTLLVGVFSFWNNGRGF